MKQEILNRGIYTTIMLVFLQLSLFTTDVFISHIFAAVSIVVGAFACRLPHNQTKIKYE